MKQKNLISLGVLVLATSLLATEAKANTVLGAAVGAAVGSAIGQQGGGNGAIIGGAIGGAVGAEMGREAEGHYSPAPPPPPVYEVRRVYEPAPVVVVERPGYYYGPYWRRPHWGHAYGRYGYYRRY
ncbi:MAG: YMGG-like glycine zipper-containing protein [Pseudobdellovibrio sp.]